MVSKPRIWVIGLVILGALFITGTTFIGVVYWWGTQGARAVGPIHHKLRACMTFTEMADVMRDSPAPWYWSLRPAGQDARDWINLRYHDDKKISFFGHLERTGDIPETWLDDAGARGLAGYMGSTEWVAEIKFIDPITVYEFDVTIDSNHKVKTISEVREKAPHD